MEVILGYKPNLLVVTVGYAQLSGCDCWVHAQLSGGDCWVHAQLSGGNCGVHAQLSSGGPRHGLEALG